jgi:outer membrane protein assembly factor BamB
MRIPLCLAMVVMCAVAATAADWPTWRHDPGRGAEWTGDLPAELHPQWVRHYPPLVPAYRNARLHFDAGYEPVVKDGTMFVGSSLNDRLTALDVATGAEKWRFHAEGPIRFAPVAWQDRVYVGSDDGHVYCLRAEDGKLVWKFRAVPSDRKVLGNGRLTSVWPVRGGPVIADDVLFFAAGVWSFEGVFVYALKAESGELVWVDDRTSFLYGQHPHDARAFGGLTPQGYLVVSGDELIVPCGTALPARLDRTTGELKHFALPRQGRVPGGWFATVSAARRRGLPVPEQDRLLFDSDVNRERHEGGWREGQGESGIRSRVSLNGQEIAFEDGYPGVEGTVHSILAADGRLFVVTKEGEIHCFGSNQVPPKTYPLEQPPSVAPRDTGTSDADEIIAATNVEHGYALVWGAGDGRLIEQLAHATQLHLIVVESDEQKCAELRRRMDGAGLLGTRVAIHAEVPSQVAFPPYLANLVLIGDLGSAGFQLESADDFVDRLWQTLRPYGGTAHVHVRAEFQTPFRQAIERADLDGVEWNFEGDRLLLARREGLPGASNYTGGWSSPDERVRAPLAVLWFDDALSHFKRAPQPMIVDGVMISYDKDWRGWVDGVRPPYPLLPPTYSDIYTGRVFAPEEVQRFAASLPTRDVNEKQLEQYRPPTQADAWKPELPVVGERTSPLTGLPEPRAIPKSYGCDGGIDYGNVYTLRSGTAAFYDKLLESGTIHISGPRSGCTNSVIPAGGILNVPYFFEGCSCSYPLPVGLAMVSVPPEREQWAVWGEGDPEEIRRVGINFGAPGVRMSPEGTLWLEHPRAGGPAPTLQTSTVPDAPHYYYRHSVWVEGGSGWPWVAASGVRGMTSFTIEGLKSGRYTLRLYFAEPEHDAPGQRVFDVLLNDEPIVSRLDIARESGAAMRSLVKEFHGVRLDGSLQLQLEAHAGEPVISGIELVEDGLAIDELSAYSARLTRQLEVPRASD